MLLVLALWSVAMVALVTGVAICLYRHVRTSEDRIRAPLQRQLEQHRKMLQQDQSARAAQDLFLASLSHELRTPLSGIQGAVQLLRNSGLKGSQHEYVNMVSYASTTVLEIVDDMLTYSRMQSGNIQVESLPFNVRQLIDDMLALQSIKAQDRNIVLISDIARDVPLRLMGDRGKLNQVLLNLIGNAIKFTDEGSVTVSVTRLPDRDQDTDPGNDTASPDVRLEFMIRDSGIGMSEEEISRVFEPFVQGHAARLEGRQGTGLGLAICRRLLHAMGGEIHIDSVPKEGTSVSFQLSLAREDPRAALTTGNHAGSQGRCLVVLVVDDDDINRLVCTRYLALAGHHPVAVADERQVQHVMSLSGRVPDVVLMDVNLAGHSGIELVAKMRTLEDGRWQNVPVIAMSADNSGRSQQQALAGGIPVFLAKPFSADQLNDALDSVTLSVHGDDPADTCTRLPSAADTDARNPEIEHIPAATPVAGPDLLDPVWLADETDTLGVDVMFELLTVFRSSAAKTLKELVSAVGRQDWQATADLLHGLQGSASNLGMRHLVDQAKALRANVLVEGGPHPAYVDAKVVQLEAACHASADSVRVWLLGTGSEGVAFATQRNDQAGA